MKLKHVLVGLLRVGIGALFVFAGVLKLRDPATFAVEITNYRWFAALAPWLAVTLPPVEVVVGAALIVAPAAWRRGAALAVAGLSALFTVAVAQALGRGINVDCGCFGGGSGPVTGWVVARDVLLIAGALVIYRLSPADRPRALPR
jgi:hypothetical protein